MQADGPNWAEGCERCRYGIIAAPRPGLCELYIERAILARHGRVIFCDCRAGHMARQYARRVWQDIESGKEYVHPNLVANVVSAAAETPTVHGPEPIRERVMA